MENLTDYCKLYSTTDYNYTVCIIEAHATYLMFIRSVSLLREHAMVSVGFCVVSTVKRAYPLEDATHIALSNFCFEIKHHIWGYSFLMSPTFIFLGTVRRFLESHGENIETVVFAVSDVEEVCGISFSLLCNSPHPLTLLWALSFSYEILVLI